MNPPWESKYTININTEMNYWPAESGNLGECVEPLIGDGQGPHRYRRAHRARACMAPAAGWRITTPTSGGRPRRSTGRWGIWPTGGAWLCQHLWEHYVFSGDRRYLTTHLSGDERRGGVLPRYACGGARRTSGSSPVPRSRRRTAIPKAPRLRRADDGPADHPRPVRQLHPGRGRSSAWTRNFRKQLAATRARLAPNQIGKAGPVAGMAGGLGHGGAGERHHRHVSHLYGLYPSRRSSPARHARTGRGGAKVAGNPRRQRHRLGHRLAHQSVGAPAGRRPRLQDSEAAARARSAPIRTCSTPIRRSRSTATSAAPPASRRCCCKAASAPWQRRRRRRPPPRSNSCPRFPRPGRPAA